MYRWLFIVFLIAFCIFLVARLPYNVIIKGLLQKASVDTREVKFSFFPPRLHLVGVSKVQKGIKVEISRLTVVPEWMSIFTFHPAFKLHAGKIRLSLPFLPSVVINSGNGLLIREKGSWQIRNIRVSGMDITIRGRISFSDVGIMYDLKLKFGESFSAYVGKFLPYGRDTEGWIDIRGKL